MSKDAHRTDSVGHKFMGRPEVTIWHHMTIYARGCRMHGCLTAIGRPRRIFNRGTVTSRPGNEKVKNILSTSQARLTEIFDRIN